MSLDSLGNKSRKGMLWDLAGTGSRQIASLIVSVILARLLEPEQFGVIGIAMVFISITQVFIDVGFSDGLIQKKNVTESSYSSVFFINIFIGLVLSLVIFFAASLIGTFYKNAQIIIVLQYLAIVPFIAALGKVHSARLIKEFKFKALSIRSITATIVGGLVGIVLAIKGYGVYSLVGQQIVAALIGTILLWVGSNWIPSLVFSFKEVNSLMKFSSFIFFSQVLRQIFQKVDALFIGKVFSPVILGFYTRAESLTAIVTQYTASALQNVSYPIFCTVQDDENRFKLIYFKMFSLASTVSPILAGILFFLSDIIIVGLLGEKWEASIIIFQILIFRILFSPFGSLMSSALLSLGYSKLKFKFSLIMRFIGLFPMLIGFFFGIELFAITLVCTAFIGFLIFALVLNKFVDLSFKDQFIRFITPIVPLIVLVLLRGYYFSEVNSVVIAAGYLIIQMTYLIIIKDSGLYILYQELKTLIRKVST